VAVDEGWCLFFHTHCVFIIAVRFLGLNIF